MKEMTQKVVIKFGVPLLLASAGYLGFVNAWEDGPRQQNTVYPDRLAKGLPTACGGITKHTSPVPVIVGEVWSAEKCNEVATLVAEKSQLKLLDCVRTRISQNTFDALSSHAHNLGVANTCASRALELINRGQLLAGCQAIARAPDGSPVWSYVTQSDGSKKFVQGLYNRRRAETALCQKPDAQA